MSQQENKSGLHPLGRAVLIKPLDSERLSSVIAIPDNVKALMHMVEQEAIVVEVGPEAWVDEAFKRAYPGNRVMVTKYAGFMAEGPLDGEAYRLVNDRDIFCRVEVPRARD